MNTYYELITFLNNCVLEKEISIEIINDFKTFKTYLEGERYNRFINHLKNTLNDRINIKYNKIQDLLSNTISANEFMNIVDSIKNESLNQIELINTEFIKKEDQEKLYNIIKDNYNGILDKLKLQYNNFETIVNYLNNNLMN